MIERDGFIYFTEKPCRSNDGCDEAFPPAELAEYRAGPRRAALPDSAIRTINRRRLSGDSAETLAADYGLTTRTIHRYIGRRVKCPTCPTVTPGGRTCHFCRRTSDGR